MPESDAGSVPESAARSVPESDARSVPESDAGSVPESDAGSVPQPSREKGHKVQPPPGSKALGRQGQARSAHVGPDGSQVGARAGVWHQAQSGFGHRDVGFPFPGKSGCSSSGRSSSSSSSS